MTKDMDAEALAALKASIAKWEKNARVRKAKNAQVFSDSCPLCDVFLKNPETWDCEGCPVEQFSGHDFCDNTPWARAATLRIDAICDPRAKTVEAFRAAACEEVTFLKSLLPEAEQ